MDFITSIFNGTKDEQAYELLSEYGQQRTGLTKQPFYKAWWFKYLLVTGLLFLLFFVWPFTSIPDGEEEIVELVNTKNQSSVEIIVTTVVPVLVREPEKVQSDSDKGDEITQKEDETQFYDQVDEPTESASPWQYDVNNPNKTPPPKIDNNQLSDSDLEALADTEDEKAMMIIGDYNNYFKDLNILQNDSPPNTNFYFDNVMTRSGHKPVRVMLEILKKKNGFYLSSLFQRTGITDGITGGSNDISKIANWDISNIEDVQNDDYEFVTKVAQDIQKEMISIKKPYFLQQKYRLVDFTKYGHEQPTMINIVRNPIDKYVSHYYHCRKGSIADPNFRCPGITQSNLQIKDSISKDMTVDDYLLDESNQNIDTMYSEWFCAKEAIKCLPGTPKKEKFDYIKVPYRKFSLVTFSKNGVGIST